MRNILLKCKKTHQVISHLAANYMAWGLCLLSHHLPLPPCPPSLFLKQPFSLGKLSDMKVSVYNLWNYCWVGSTFLSHWFLLLKTCTVITPETVVLCPLSSIPPLGVASIVNPSLAFDTGLWWGIGDFSHIFSPPSFRRSAAFSFLLLSSFFALSLLNMFPDTFSL